MNDETELAESVQQSGDKIASALRALGTGDAATSMGAVELLAMEIKNGSERIAGAIETLAEAIRDSAGV